MAKTDKTQIDVYSVSALYQVAPGRLSGGGMRPCGCRPGLNDELPWTSLHGVTKVGYDARLAFLGRALPALRSLVELLEGASEAGTLTPAESSEADELGTWLERLEAEEKLLRSGETAP